MSGTTVTLDACEIRVAIAGGIGRHLRAIELGRKHQHGLDGGGEWNWKLWYADVLAFAAEVAAARCLDVYWRDAPQPDTDGDIGNPPRYHVRHTVLESGRLILRPTDVEDSIFVLVVGTVPVFRVVGWITSDEGMEDEYWVLDLGNQRPPCWMIPQHALRPIEELQR